MTQNEWRRRQENQAARQRQEDQEAANRENLERMPDNWKKSQQLREFINAVEKKCHPILPSSELAGWSGLLLRSTIFSR